MDATRLGVLDWIRLRRLLADYRNGAVSGKVIEAADLARAMHVEESTIYRIENIKKDENYKPKLTTIDAWIDATAPGTLLSFFAQITASTTAAHPLDDQSTPALKVDDDEAPTQAEKIEQLTRRIETLEKFIEEDAERTASANLARAKRHKAARARDRQPSPGAGDGGSGTGRARATPHRAAVREDSAAKKTVRSK